MWWRDSSLSLIHILIGAGANYGTALEGAVKIGETVHILAVGYLSLIHILWYAGRRGRRII